MKEKLNYRCFTCHGTGSLRRPKDYKVPCAYCNGKGYTENRFALQMHRGIGYSTEGFIINNEGQVFCLTDEEGSLCPLRIRFNDKSAHEVFTKQILPKLKTYLFNKKFTVYFIHNRIIIINDKKKEEEKIRYVFDFTGEGYFGPPNKEHPSLEVRNKILELTQQQG